MKEFLASHTGAVAYVARFTKDRGTWRISFPDFPGVDAIGGRGADEMAVARDALIDAITSRMRRKQRIPKPSRRAVRRHGDSAECFERTLPADQVLAMKAILWDTMCAEEVSNVALAKALGCDEKEVRRLIDPSSGSRSKLEEALNAVGKPIAVTVVDSSRPRRMLKVPGSRGGYVPSLERAIVANGGNNA